MLHKGNFVFFQHIDIFLPFNGFAEHQHYLYAIGNFTTNLQTTKPYVTFEGTYQYYSGHMITLRMKPATCIIRKTVS